MSSDSSTEGRSRATRARKSPAGNIPCEVGVLFGEPVLENLRH